METRKQFIYHAEFIYLRAVYVLRFDELSLTSAVIRITMRNVLSDDKWQCRIKRGARNPIIFGIRRVCVHAPVLCFLNTFAAHRTPDLRLHAHLIYRNDDGKFMFIRGRIRAILAAMNAPEINSQKR